MPAPAELFVSVNLITGLVLEISRARSGELVPIPTLPFAWTLTKVVISVPSSPCMCIPPAEESFLNLTFKLGPFCRI